MKCSPPYGIASLLLPGAVNILQFLGYFHRPLAHEKRGSFETQSTRRRKILWRIGRCRFSISPQASGQSIVRKAESVLFVGTSRQTKHHFLCDLCASAVKLNNFVLCLIIIGISMGPWG